MGDAAGIQAVNLAGQLGAQSANWCDFTDTDVEITWVTAGPLTFHVIVEYTDTPFR